VNSVITFYNRVQEYRENGIGHHLDNIRFRLHCGGACMDETLQAGNLQGLLITYILATQAIFTAKRRHYVKKFTKKV
jgi:hypothetical protein